MLHIVVVAVAVDGHQTVGVAVAPIELVESLIKRYRINKNVQNKYLFPDLQRNFNKCKYLH